VLDFYRAMLYIFPSFRYPHKIQVRFGETYNYKKFVYNSFSRQEIFDKKWIRIILSFSKFNIYNILLNMYINYSKEVVRERKILLQIC
jgi:hypothetical protein